MVRKTLKIAIIAVTAIIIIGIVSGYFDVSSLAFAIEPGV